MKQCQWSKASGKLSESCKQVQWCQEELADPLLNSGRWSTRKVPDPFPTHVCTHTHTSPSFQQKRCHRTICHSCTSSSREISPGTPFGGWRLCFWRDKPTSISTSNINTARTVVSKEPGLQSNNKQQKATALHKQHIPNPKSNSSVQRGRTSVFPKGLGNVLT